MKFLSRIVFYSTD